RRDVDRAAARGGERAVTDRSTDCRALIQDHAAACVDSYVAVRRGGDGSAAEPRAGERLAAAGKDDIAAGVDGEVGGGGRGGALAADGRPGQGAAGVAAVDAQVAHDVEDLCVAGNGGVVVGTASAARNRNRAGVDGLIARNAVRAIVGADIG